MREYLEWRQDEGTIKIRVHRRVLAHLGCAGMTQFCGTLLGTVWPAMSEIVVETFVAEDLAPLKGNSGVTAGTNSMSEAQHGSLAPVGSFRVGSREELRITDQDRELFTRRFPGPLHALLVFQLGADHAE